MLCTPSSLEFSVVNNPFCFSLKSLNRFLFHELHLDRYTEFRGQPFFYGFLEFALLLHFVEEYLFRYFDEHRGLIERTLAVDNDLVMRGDAFDLEQYRLDLLRKDVHAAND